MNRAVDSNMCWAIAHRGTPREHPENTIAGFDRAVELGCDGIELDVQLSRDGVAVIFHDRTLTRAGGGRKRVHQLDLAELRRLDAGVTFKGSTRTHPIPTLDTVIKRYSGRTRLLVEVKTREGLTAARRHEQLAALVAASVRDGVPQGMAWVLSFDATVLGTVARVAPDLPRVLNVRPGLPGLGSRLRRARPAIVDADVRTLTPAFGRRVRRGGRALWSFTCNTPRTLQCAQDAGATAVISDRIDWLVEQLGRP